MSGLPQFRLPDLLSQWTWPRKLNQHHQEVKSVSDKWLRDFKPLDAKSQRSFDFCDFPLFCSLGYPLLDKDCLRVSCDLMMLFFVYDEYTDNAADADDVRIYANIVKDVLQNPHPERPPGESILGEITRQFWLRAITVASEPAQRRFIKAFNEYVFGVAHEATDRTSGRIRSIVDYFQLRKRTVGAYSSFMCIELGLEIPDKVMEHPALQSLLSLTTDSIILTNDLYSYNNEQAVGHDGHNIITVVMNEKGVDLDGALNWLEKYNDEVLTKFQTQRRMLPSWDPDMNRVVNEYVERLGYWIRGHDQWSFESRRYFGAKGPEIQECRLVTLLPKVMKPGVTPMMVPSMVQPSVPILIH